MRTRRAGRIRKAKLNSTLRAKVLHLAAKEIGVKESPPSSNSGPRVSTYERATGAYGQPWCASFITWLLKSVGYKGAFPENPAYCPSWVDMARAARHGVHMVSASQMEEGDLALYDWDNDGVADHIGITESKVHGGVFTAIEGNTSLGNNSNGGEVMRRERNVSDVLCFIRVLPA
jgi:hypothetical protein